MEQDEVLSKRKTIFLREIINFHVALLKDVVHHLVSFIIHLSETSSVLSRSLWHKSVQVPRRRGWRMLQWCYQMKCLMVGERPGITNGGWGAWSSWSRCSRTCGSGVAYAVRKCNQPSPSNGGSYCVGDRKRHKICATDVSFESVRKQLSNKCSANLRGLE